MEICIHKFVMYTIPRNNILTSFIYFGTGEFVISSPIYATCIELDMWNSFLDLFTVKSAVLSLFIHDNKLISYIFSSFYADFIEFNQVLLTFFFLCSHLMVIYNILNIVFNDTPRWFTPKSTRLHVLGCSKCAKMYYDTTLFPYVEKWKVDILFVEKKCLKIS